MDTQLKPEAGPAAADEGPATIGEVAARFGITLRSLRYYEDRGLISPRRIGPTRLYDRASLRRLELILKGKTLGFTLSEIRAMVGAQANSDQLAMSADQVAAQIEMLRKQRSGIEIALEELEATRARMAAENAPYLGGARSAENRAA